MNTRDYIAPKKKCIYTKNYNYVKRSGINASCYLRLVSNTNKRGKQGILLLYSNSGCNKVVMYNSCSEKKKLLQQKNKNKKRRTHELSFALFLCHSSCIAEALIGLNI